MIIYFAGRIVAWLYGYAWPLANPGARSCLAVFSIIEMVILGPLVIGSVVITIVNHFESKMRVKQIGKNK